MKKNSLILASVVGLMSTIYLGCAGGSGGTGIDVPAYSGPGSHYTFGFSGSNFKIKKFATISSTTADFTVTGTTTALGTGFQLLSVGAVTGTGGPTVGSTAYGIEIPGVALFIKPIAAAGSEIIAAVSAGNCPTTNVSDNWIIVKKPSASDMSSPTQDTYGTFAYNVSTGVATLPAKYSLANTGTSLGSQTFSSATCSSGIMTVDAGGDIATMYFTSSGAVMVNTASGVAANSSHILGFPAATLTGSNFTANYAGLVFNQSASSEQVKPIHITLAWNGTTLSGTGAKVSNVETGTLGTETAAISLTPNSPSAGFLTGTITMNGTATNLACMAVENVGGTSKEMINCSGRDPGDSTKLFNFLMVTR